MTGIAVVDAFTDRPFAGNPAAVCIMDSPAEAAWMQAVAAEMNLSETAFLHPEGDAWRLRWFTPTQEVDLCGHATLASAHRLWETGALVPDADAVFETRSGRLTCRRDGRSIAMDLPVLPAGPAEAPGGLFEALGTDPVPVHEAANGNLLMELPTADAVRALRPDFSALLRVSGRHGYIVTAAAGEEDLDFVCRYFVPAWGIDEDPVTGSAQCTLAPYWAKRLGRTLLRSRQVSARGGDLEATLGDGRITLRGRAVTVWEGDLRG